MTFKPYVHNADIYKRHFVGKAMPVFRGQRIQRGGGFTFLRRLAVPLLQMVGPHIATAASSLAQKAMKKIFPKHPKMQRMVGDVVRAGANSAVRSVQKRKVRAGSASVKKQKRRKTTSNIFD